MITGGEGDALNSNLTASEQRRNHPTIGVISLCACACARVSTDKRDAWPRVLNYNYAKLRAEGPAVVFGASTCTLYRRYTLVNNTLCC